MCSRSASGSTGSKAARRAAVASVLLFVGGCATAPLPPGGYRVNGQAYVPLPTASGFSEVGLASWYGPGFHGRKTSSGETYDMYGRTAAHKLLPLGTVVRVSSLENGRTVFARINDRGPFVEGRVIDVSYALARDLDLLGQGTARVRVEAVEGPGGAPAPAQPVGPFAWQVGAFTRQDNAQSLAGELRSGFASVEVARFDRGDSTFHRVRVGRYATVAEAQRDLAALRGRSLDPFLVRVD